MNDDNGTVAHATFSATCIMMSRSSRRTCLDTPIWGMIMGCREKFGGWGEHPLWEG